MSLVRTLMSGVTESATDLSQFDYSSEASMESFWLDSACESLVNDIYSVDRTYRTADVIGEVKVLTEGADPSVLLEGLISSGIEKIKEAFKKFLAKIKEWAAKVKKFFKIIFLKGKDFVKEFGKEIRGKSVKGFKYKGYNYAIEDTDAEVENMTKIISGKIDGLLGVAEGVTRDSKANAITTDDIKAMINVDDKSSSDWQDALCKECKSSCGDLTELSEYLTEQYRGGDNDKEEIEDFEGRNDPSDMLSFIEGYDKEIKNVESEERKFEKEINSIIKNLDKMVVTSKNNRKEIEDGDTNVTDKAYKAASTVSSYLSAALTVQKTIVDKKVSMHKEACGAFTTILKSFLRFKPAKESHDLALADDIIALTEAGDAVEPDVSAEEEGADTEEKSKDATTEGAALFESAYNYL